MTPLGFRPVINGNLAWLPSAAGLAPMPLHAGISFQGLAFHPDRPWLAICRIGIGATAIGNDEASFALTVSAERLRAIAARMIEIADHLDIKPPAKEPGK